MIFLHLTVFPVHVDLLQVKFNPSARHILHTKDSEVQEMRGIEKWRGGGKKNRNEAMREKT